MNSIRLALIALAAVPAAMAAPRIHFYTTNPSGEGARSAGYTAGGVTAYAFSSQASGTAPMYRCINDQYGLHFYTLGQNCDGAGGYRQEGIAWYCYPGQSGNSVSLDRYFNPKSGDHWYVVRGQEQGQGDLPYYNFEGTSCYVYSGQVSGTVPIYNWAKGSN